MTSNAPRVGHDTPPRKNPILSSTLILASLAILLPTIMSQAMAQPADTSALERRVADLQRQLEAAQRELEQARASAARSEPKAVPAEPMVAEATPAPAPNPAPAESDKITLGPLTIGGAMRVNYILGDYPNGGGGPSRGGNGGNFELDTFRINVDLKYQQLAGKLEYRWYNGYNFIHTGWLGWDFDDGSQVQLGVSRVPFGPGPYGVSQSWFFDQHYYVGLADDMDLGIKYKTTLGNWKLDLAYYNRSEWNGNGTSQDSARYSYDAVIWGSALDPDGNVVAGPPNGYQERNQFNVRGIYSFDDIAVPTDLGISLQYGQLEGRRASDGSGWAASVHMTNSWNNWLLASQLTRYKYDVDDVYLLGSDQLLPLGAFDFAWPAAADAWIPAVSLSYLFEADQVPWLDSVRPYIEYSSIIKQDSEFSDSEMFVLGAAWASGGWYVYTDLAYSNGNFFVGNNGDNYANIFNGVGDFGVNGNDKWNYRFNVNLGYYF
jgi:hypothetical protein